MTPKPHQQRNKSEKVRRRKHEIIDSSYDAYINFIRYFFNNVDTNLFMPVEKSSKPDLPQKMVRTQMKRKVEDNEGKVTSTLETVIVPQHRRNTVVAPFKRFIHQMLRITHPHLIKSEKRVGWYLDRLLQGFAKELCFRSSRQVTKNFHVVIESVLIAMQQIISSLDYTDEDKALLVDKMQKFLDKITQDVVRIKEMDQSDIPAAKRQTIKGLYKQYIGLQPQGFTNFLMNCFPRSVASVNQSARFLIDLLVSTFGYHICLLFGSLYKDGKTRSDCEERKNMADRFFTANESLRNASQHYTIKPEHELAAMQFVPLFDFLHKSWNIPQDELPGRYVRVAKRKRVAATTTTTNEKSQTASSKGRERASKRSASAANSTTTQSSSGKRLRATQ